MTTINTELPIELWNIILNSSTHGTVKNFMYMVMMYKVFEPYELSELKIKYMYDHIIASSPINNIIYSIYNKLDLINTKQKYINYYSKIFCELQFMSNITSDDREVTFFLRNYLAEKIENKDLKQKFENLTSKLFSYQYDKKNEILKMLEFIN
jgi:hypothetical protein